MSAPVCPSCGKLGVGERCAHCGAAMKPAAPAVKRAEMPSVAVPGLALETAAIGDRAGSPGVATDERPRKAAAYLSLQPSETAVLAAASRILSGFIASGALNETNQDELADRAVRMATRMAVVIERYVQSDGEDW